MTNTGSVPIDTPGVGTNFIEVGSGKTLVLQAVSQTAPCTIHYTDCYLPATQQVQIFADIFFADSPLAIGATTSCLVGITIDATAPQYFVQEFGFLGGVGVDTVNRFVFVPFLLGSLSTPIPAFWPFGSIVLALALFVLAYFRVKERRTVRPHDRLRVQSDAPVGTDLRRPTLPEMERLFVLKNALARSRLAGVLAT